MKLVDYPVTEITSDETDIQAMISIVKFTDYATRRFVSDAFPIDDASAVVKDALIDLLKES
jgi:hypothetical protein